MAEPAASHSPSVARCVQHRPDAGFAIHCYLTVQLQRLTLLVIATHRQSFKNLHCLPIHTFDAAFCRYRIQHTAHGKAAHHIASRRLHHRPGAHGSSAVFDRLAGCNRYEARR
jgi:hypothetical protein